MEKNLRDTEICSATNFIDDVLNHLRDNKGLDEYINLKPQYEILKKEEQDIFDNISGFEMGTLNKEQIISNLNNLKAKLKTF